MDKIGYGILGEMSAAQYLEQKSYRILEKNFASKIGEVDIIALDGATYVFVEVKHRASLKYGYPAEAVTPHKQYKISQVAASYIKYKALYDRPVRFDVIEVLDSKWIRHIENAFESRIRF